MEKPTLGRRRSAIAEGYIPDRRHRPEPQMLSHETACLPNANDNALMTTVPFAE